MPTSIHNLSQLIHFDENGDFFAKQNCTLTLENDGTVSDITEKKPVRTLDNAIDGTHMIALPSFVDCHSHAIFAGDRSVEFQKKCQGSTYSDIAREGGGILFTQAATKHASDVELADLVEKRLCLFRGQGVFGVEIKTGYGLSHDEEIRHLRILQNIKKKLHKEMKIWITYLGAHAVEKGRDKNEYLHEICTRTLPYVAMARLADFVDIFVDEGFFSVQDMEKFCETAVSLGLKCKAHIDEIKNLCGSEVAVRYKVVSVDHCRHTTKKQLEALRDAKVQMVILPATSFYIDEGFVPFKFFSESNVRPALSLDYNPGSQPALSWPLLLHLGMKKMGMNEMELLHAVCVAPLHALSEPVSEWSLGVGKKCKLNLYKASSISELAYRYGENLLERGIFHA